MISMWQNCFLLRYINWFPQTAEPVLKTLDRVPVWSLCWYLSQLESAGRMLKVTGAKLEDSGRYTCLATNAAGEAQQHIRLSVHGNVKLNKAPLQHVSVTCLSLLLVSGKQVEAGEYYLIFFFVQLSACPTEPPSIPSSGDIVNQTILSGFPTKLECKATGSPLPGRMAR